MATYSPPAQDQPHHEQKAPLIPPASEAMAGDTSINGSAFQENSTLDLPSKPLENGVLDPPHPVEPPVQPVEPSLNNGISPPASTEPLPPQQAELKPPDPQDPLPAVEEPQTILHPAPLAAEASRNLSETTTPAPPMAAQPTSSSEALAPPHLPSSSSVSAIPDILNEPSPSPTPTPAVAPVTVAEPPIIAAPMTEAVVAETSIVETGKVADIAVVQEPAVEVVADTVVHAPVAQAIVEEPERVSLTETVETVSPPIAEQTPLALSIETTQATVPPPSSHASDPTSQATYVEPPEPVSAIGSEQDTSSTVPMTIKIPREREEDVDDAPSAKRTKTDDGESEAQGDAMDVDFKKPDVPPTTPSVAGVANPIEPENPVFDFGPTMTEAQRKALIDGTRNLKKGKHATNFTKPVDWQQLNLPTYPEIVKTPMDLSTIEAKLKASEYKSVDEYLQDFDLMVNNAILFNGSAHPVAQAATMLRSVLTAQLRKLPKAGEAPADVKKERKSSVSIATREPLQRRASRPSSGALPSPSAQTYAPGPDGVPLIRRDSSTADGRPKREIQKPKSRDLPWSGQKPRKKKFMAELKFCESILEELRRPRYDAVTSPFREPVDPVALNIPNYHKIVKKPMDLTTINNKLTNGHYENASEFQADFKQMLKNCYTFNGETHPVAMLGKELERNFDEMFLKKQEWIAEHDPHSEVQSPEAASDSEEQEEEDEEEDNEHDFRAHQLAEIQKQIADLSAKATSLLQPPPASESKKSKTKSTTKKAAGKPGKPAPKRKSSSLGGGTSGKLGEKKPKAKPKSKKVTIQEKQEISNRIGELPPDQISRAADIIKSSLKRAGHPVADEQGDDLEFDIDTIPDDALHELLKLVRTHLGQSTYTDFGETKPEPVARSAQPSKPKKNKPMSKFEQEERIRRLNEQLSGFQSQTAGAAASPGGNVDPDSSGDEPESGSESEEE